MKCPHCSQGFFENWQQVNLGRDIEYPMWFVEHCECPNCSKRLIRIKATTGGATYPVVYFARPLHQIRPIPPEVTAPFSADFAEACAVLSISPKASAALSRRLLQHILKEKGGAKKRDLMEQIDELLPTLPGYLKTLHAIRQVGNFAAHPSKDKNTGEIVEVEPGEAEWLLDMLEGLFDFYFVQPAVQAKQLAELNRKLAAAGKPQIAL
jgi:hypothetical protein